MLVSATQISNDTLHTAADRGDVQLDTYCGMKTVEAIVALYGNGDQATARVMTGRGVSRREWTVERRDLLVEQR